jgi:hypothetical protein
MPLKQQSAVEFLITYSWALLAVSLFVVAVLVLANTKAPSTYLQSSCNIQPLLPCEETLLAYNAPNPIRYYLIFTNQLGSVLYFPPNSLNVSTSGSESGVSVSRSVGNCVPNFASQGATVFCEANLNSKSEPTAGIQTIIDFQLNYNICNTDNTISCAPGTYRSSGYSVQDVAPRGVTINNITFITNPSGTIVLNGVTYFTKTSAYLASGNYVIYAQPPSGMAFGGWSVTNAPTTKLASLSNQNTILEVSSNGVITAEFH